MMNMTDQPPEPTGVSAAMAIHAVSRRWLSLPRPGHMKKPLFILMAFLVMGSMRAEVFTGESRNDQFTIHGRLSCYNGGSTFRIWIVGSKRMLYVAGDTTPALARLNEFFADGDAWFKRDIFADFTVEPLVSDIKGHMRPVRIINIKHVVISSDGKVIARRDEL
jgi:hypothetical protein